MSYPKRLQPKKQRDRRRIRCLKKASDVLLNGDYKNWITIFTESIEHGNICFKKENESLKIHKKRIFPNKFKNYCFEILNQSNENSLFNALAS